MASKAPAKDKGKRKRSCNNLSPSHEQDAKKRRVSQQVLTTNEQVEVKGQDSLSSTEQKSSPQPSADAKCSTKPLTLAQAIAEQQELSANEASAFHQFCRVTHRLLAAAWLQLGCRSFLEVSERFVLSQGMLNRMALIDDLERSIPRDEVYSYIQKLKTILNTISKGTTIIPVGQYRLGLEKCNRISVLVISNERKKPSLAQIANDLWAKVIPALEQRGFTSKRLQGGDLNNPSGELAIKPLNQPRSPWRRLHIVIGDASIKGALMVWYTGSLLFRSALDRVARDRDLIFTEKGIFTRDTSKTKKQRQLKGGATEGGIFQALDLPFVELEDRDI